MHPSKFASIIEASIASMNSLATVKGGEYASDSDRLSNFREASRRLGLLPEEVLLVYLDKHYAALCNYVRDLKAGRNRPRSEPIEGRADDMILYIILFKALLAERTDVSEAANESSLQWDDEEH